MAGFNAPRDASAAELMAAVQRMKVEVNAAVAELDAAALRAARGAPSRGVGIAGQGGGAVRTGRAAAGDELLGALGRERAIPQVSTDLQRLSQVQSVASAQMSRHGALTTEFLAALARGDATLSDFGYHISGTIGKFAGWTAAAGAVYTAVGAIKELSTGAKDAASGTDQLARFIDHVDRAKAQQGFRDVSQELNVPIKDVGDAQAQFARIFKDQGTSLDAARVSLLATKIDNVSTADSYRFLTGIVQEFQLPASRLPLLFDQISAAQRRAGGRVAELLPAFARSAAAVKNASSQLGTDDIIKQQIALLNTAQVASGQTGQSVGTAFYRAPRFVNKNAEVIKQFGLDPSEPFTQFLIDATHKAENLAPALRRNLAEAIGGPQLGARIFQPLLNRSALLDKSLGVVDPAKAQGSAQEELRHKLAQVDEQLKAVGNNFQRLGSALAQSGAFAGLGLLLQALNKTLELTTHIVEAFDRLPSSVSTALALFVEMRLVLAGIQKTAIGTGLADRAGVGFLVPQQERLRRTALQGESRQAELFGASAVDNTSRATATRATQEQLRRQEQMLIAEAGEATVLQSRNVLTERATALAKRRENLEGQALEFEAAATANEELEAEAISRRNLIKSRKVTLTEEGAILENEAAVATAAGAGAAAAGAQAANVERSTVASRALGGANTLWANKMRIFNGLLIAGIGYEFLSQAMNDSAQATYKQAIDTSTAITSADDAKTRIDAAGKTLNDHNTFGESFNEARASLRGEESPRTTRDRAARSTLEEAATVQRAREHTVNNPWVMVDRTYAEINSYYASDLKALQTGLISKAEFDRRMALYARSAKVSLDAIANPGGVAQYLHDLQTRAAHDLQPSKADPFSQFRGDTAPKDTLTFLQTGTERAQARGQGGDFQQLARGFVFATQKFNGVGGQNLKDLLAAQALFDSTVQKNVDDQLKASLASTDDPAQRRKIYDDAISKVGTARNNLYKALGDSGKELVTAENKLNRLQREKQQSDQARAGGGLGGLLGAVTSFALDREIKTQQDKVNALRRNLTRTGTAVAAEEGKLAELLRQLKEQQYSDYQTNLDIQSAFQQSQTSDKVSQITTAIHFDELLVESAISTFGAHSKQALQAITKANNDRQKLVDEQRNRLVSGNELATSQIQETGTSGDRARSQSQLQGLYRVLAFDRAHNADIVQINQDLIAINNARRQLADQAAKDATALYDAKLEVAIASTDDPIQKAKLELQRDKHDIKGLTGADYYKQLAKVKGDEKNVRSAIITEDLDQARFLFQTEQIASDEYIAQLQAILRLKGISKQQRRQILQEIYQVQNKDAGQLELNVDQIHVPTSYEVRRALAASGGLFTQTGGGGGVQQTNHLSIIINAKEGIKEIAAELDRTLNTAVEAAIRAGGSI